MRNWGLLLTFFALPVLFAGCSAHSIVDPAVQFADILKDYPPTREALTIQQITTPLAGTALAHPDAVDVTIMVHPAYSLFIDKDLDEQYSEAKLGLMKKQLEHEAKFMSDQAQFGNVVVLILPRDSVPDNAASAYVTYLNRTTHGKNSVVYFYSETRESGNLEANDVATLCGFLEAVKVRKLLIGGGYIGRCQGELYGQIIDYCSPKEIYIVPEISSVSLEDISEREAVRMYTGVLNQDYAQVREFILKHTVGDIKTLSIPQMK